MSGSKNSAQRRPRGPMGHGPMSMAGEKPKDFKGSMKKLARHLARYKFRILAVLVFAVASMIFAIIGPKILGRATNTLVEGIMGKITGTGSGIDFDKISGILLFLLLLYVISSALSYLQG